MVNFGGRPLYFEEGLPPPKASSLAGSRSGLVDLLVARRRARGAHVDRGAALLELELVSLRGVLENVDQVLSVTGVRRTRDPRALVGVVAGARDLKGLIDLAALTFLLFLLRYLGYGRYGSHGDHRQKRRQQHQLLHVVSPSMYSSSRKLVSILELRSLSSSRSFYGRAVGQTSHA